MNRLLFNQVSAPNTSSALNGLNAANQNISQGLANLSSGLSNLGARREARAAREITARKEQQAVTQAQQLEAFKLSTQGATTADQLRALATQAGPSGLPIGSADALKERETQILANLHQQAQTAGQVAQNTGFDLDNADKRQATDFAATNQELDVREQNATINGILDTNLGTQASTAKTNAERQQTLQETIGQQLGNVKLDNEITAQNAAFDRSQSDLGETDLVNEIVSRNLASGGSQNSILNDINNNPNIPDTVKIQAAQSIAERFNDNPNILDTTNPISDTEIRNIELSRSIPGGNGAQFSDTAAFVEQSNRSTQGRTPAQQIFDTASGLDPAINQKPLDEVIRERYPNQEFSAQDINDIEANTQGLSNTEAIATIDRSLGSREFGIHSILPGGKRNATLSRFFGKDERAFRPKEFRELSETLTNDINQGGLAADRNNRATSTKAARELSNKFEGASRALARARKNGTPQEVEAAERNLAIMELQRKSLEETANNARNRLLSQNGINP